MRFAGRDPGKCLILQQGCERSGAETIGAVFEHITPRKLLSELTAVHVADFLWILWKSKNVNKLFEIKDHMP